jgi:anti-anti-sigma factor
VNLKLDPKKDLCSMQFSTEISDKVLVVSVSGRLDFGTSEAFQRSLESAVVKAKGRALIIDCIGLDYISSSGMRSFMIGARASHAVGIRFLVFGLQKSAAEVFELGGFSKLIPMLSDRAAAEAAAAASE